MAFKTDGPLAPSDYLKRPYGRVVVPESDGTFRAEILEFPGCMATGDTQSEALTSLEEVAEEWLESAIAKGRTIPPPIEETDFSGKFLLRLPRSLHRKAAHAAERDGISLNQFIVSCVAEQVGMRSVQNLGVAITNVVIDFRRQVQATATSKQLLENFPTGSMGTNVRVLMGSTPQLEVAAYGRS